MNELEVSSSLEIFLVPPQELEKLVVYAAIRKRSGGREFLAARLLEALAGQAAEWAGALEWGTLTLETGGPGQPLLRLGDQPGPSISFSESGEFLWGAVTGQGQVGIDAAREEDFAPPYPYSRAFGPQEWDWAWRHCQGRTALAAALLWAAKEAAVKALGVGFHTLDPRDLEVGWLSEALEGLRLIVRVLGEVMVWARPLTNGWLAVAAI